MLMVGCEVDRFGIRQFLKLVRRKILAREFLIDFGNLVSDKALVVVVELNMHIQIALSEELVQINYCGVLLVHFFQPNIY